MFCFKAMVGSFDHVRMINMAVTSCLDVQIDKATWKFLSTCDFFFKLRNRV